MKSFVIRNGKLQPRQPDYNIPTYRILPYNHTVNPKPNDYLQATLKEQSQKYSNLQKQYWKLNKVLWKLIQNFDNAHYDDSISFFGLSEDDIQKRISLIRNIEQKQQLNLSEIKKQQFQAIQQASQQDSKQQRSRSSFNQHLLHGRQSESSTSHLDSRMKRRLSLALNQQQDLRRILQEEVQKLNKQLHIKNDQLLCVIGDIQMKNSLISKLKEFRNKKESFIKMSANRSCQSPSFQNNNIQQSNRSQRQNRSQLQKSFHYQKIKSMNEQIESIIQELILVTEQQWGVQEQNDEEQEFFSPLNNQSQESEHQINQFVLVSPRQNNQNISIQQLENGLKNVPMTKSIEVGISLQTQNIANKQNMAL